MRSAPVLDLALAAWSLVHGLAMLLVDGRLGPWGGDSRAEDLAQMVTETLQRGLAPA